MGAKPAIGVMVLAAGAAAGGCAELNLARFAPPGIIKYENIAGDQPASPEIQARIAERKAAGESKTPDLSEQPQKVPTGMSPPERAALSAELHAKRAALAETVESDRQAAVDERGVEVTLSGEGAVRFEESAEALSRAVERDAAEARKERGLPPAPPKEDADKQD